MPADVLNPSRRISALDGLEWSFVPVIAAANGMPTRTEMDAGTDLTGEYANHGGFSVAGTRIETPDLSPWPRSIRGRYSVEDMFLELYADEEGDDARDVVPMGTTGHIIKFRTGDVAAALMDVWPVVVLSCSEVTSTEAGNVLRVDFGLNGIPVIDAVVPAYAGP